MKIITLFTAVSAVGQNKITPTDTLRISGKIKKELVLTLSALDTFKNTTIGNVTILDRKGEIKENSKNLKGILLKDLFEKIEFEAESKKSLNGFYLIFSATDGFNLVLSWNELFHAKSFTNFYLITEKNGKKINELDDRLMIMEVSDAKTGHKRIEGLGTIIVEQVN